MASRIYITVPNPRNLDLEPFLVSLLQKIHVTFGLLQLLVNSASIKELSRCLPRWRMRHRQTLNCHRSGMPPPQDFITLRADRRREGRPKHVPAVGRGRFDAMWSSMAHHAPIAGWMMSNASFKIPNVESTFSIAALPKVPCLPHLHVSSSLFIPLLRFVFTQLCLGCNICIDGERITDPHSRLLHRKFWDKFDNTQTSSSSSQIHAEIREAAEGVRNDGIKLPTNSDGSLGGVPESHSPLSSSCLSHDSERDHEQHVPHLICELHPTSCRPAHARY